MKKLLTLPDDNLALDWGRGNFFEFLNYLYAGELFWHFKTGPLDFSEQLNAKNLGDIPLLYRLTLFCSNFIQLYSSVQKDTEIETVYFFLRDRLIPLLKLHSTYDKFEIELFNAYFSSVVYPTIRYIHTLHGETFSEAFKLNEPEIADIQKAVYEARYDIHYPNRDLIMQKYQAAFSRSYFSGGLKFFSRTKEFRLLKIKFKKNIYFI